MNVSQKGDMGGPRLQMYVVTASILMIFSLLFSLTPVVYSDSINPGVYSKDSAPFGVPYREWLSKWWQWNMGIPTAEHPRDNYSPEKCTVNQSGPVWFLPDILTGKEERTCTIPEGKAILVPLLTGEWHNDPSDPVPLTDSELKAAAMAGDEYGVIGAALDGTQLKNLEQYRTQSYHNITVPEDNIFKNLPGTYRGVADGFFVFLEPLPPGQHELRLTTSVSNPMEPQFNYASEGLYHLIVEPQ
jgi:hypothetical protein